MAKPISAETNVVTNFANPVRVPVAAQAPDSGPWSDGVVVLKGGAVRDPGTGANTLARGPYVDTAANLASANPTLMAGQWAYASDTQLSKLGPGVYNELPAWGGVAYDPVTRVLTVGGDTEPLPIANSGTGHGDADLAAARAGLISGTDAWLGRGAAPELPLNFNFSAAPPWSGFTTVGAVDVFFSHRRWYRVQASGRADILNRPMTGAFAVMPEKFGSDNRARYTILPLDAPAGRPALILRDWDGSSWTQSTLSADRYTQLTVGTALGTTGSVELDMAALSGTMQEISLTGNITFTTANRAAGRHMTLVLRENGTAPRTITWPAWLSLGAALPTTLDAQTLVVAIAFVGSTDVSALAGASLGVV